MIKYANAEYSGQIINDQPNGYGTMKYYSGESYVGHFSDGKFDGSGTLYLKNGDIKEGEFSNGVIVRGSYKYHNGDVFSGIFLNGKIHEGVMTYKDGCKFEGIFNLEKLYKKGTLIYEDGSKYIGEMINNNKHGHGILYTEYKYEGTFNNDLKEGVFKITKPGVYITATFHNDLLHGYYKHEENNIISEGNFENDLEEGRWKISKFGDVKYVTYSKGKLVETSEKIDLKINTSNDSNPIKTASSNDSNKFPTYIIKFENNDKNNDIVDKKSIDQLEGKIKENYAQKDRLFAIEQYVNKNFENSSIYDDYSNETYRYLGIMDNLVSTKNPLKFKLLPNGDAIYSKSILDLFNPNKLNGIGCYHAKNGNVYIGNFKHGKLNGIGYHFKSTKKETKDIYFGEYKEGNEYGTGVRFTKNCTIFGKYINKKYTGVGKIKYNDSSDYYYGEVNLKGGHGKGVLYKDNEKMMGNFINGYPYEYCLISNQKGYYEIEYVNKEGRIDGVFARYSNNNEFWCAYTYENGVLSGPAKLLSSNGGYEYKFYYLGEEANLYKNDKLEFYGKLDENGYAISGKVNLPDGRIYIGSFERGKLTGKNSKIYFSNGDVFIGEVKDGEPVNGTMTYKKPYRDLFAKYTGPFRDGIPVSFGRFYYTQPDMWCEGIIVNGLPNGSGTLHCNGKDTKYYFINGLI